MINNYTSKAEEVLIEPSSALSLAKKIKGVGYVQQYDLQNKHRGRKEMTMYWIQCLCKEAEGIVEKHLDKKLEWK